MGDNAHHMKEEIEIKLSLPESAQRAFLRHPLLQGAERLDARRLRNIYYDTPDLALHRQGIALRTRRQGRAWLQTVKCAGTAGGGLSQRPEWEQPFAGRFDFAGIDDARVAALLERHRARVRLEPAFETVFARRCWRLAPVRGSAVLIMLDRGWISAGDRREPLCEIEIELERGPLAALFEIARALVAGLPLAPEILSKAERGYRLREGAALSPLKAAPSPLLPAHTPHEAFRSVAASCLAQFQANARGAGETLVVVAETRETERRRREAVRDDRPVRRARSNKSFAPGAERRTPLTYRSTEAGDERLDAGLGGPRGGRV